MHFIVRPEKNGALAVAFELRFPAWLAGLQLSVASVFPYMVGRHSLGVWHSQNVVLVEIFHCERSLGLQNEYMRRSWLVTIGVEGFGVGLVLFKLSE